ncbi:MAG: glutathione peroxidase [Gammaproteobacteria bacterium]|nr:MAG: glutathione peroxidase [Gammaproteobacteria bacterium]
MTNSIYQFECNDIKGNPVSMSDYKDKVLLIVNTASKCGFTPQYEGLEKLQKDYAEKGFSVLGFPCNQFGGQEPGDGEAIQTFCDLTYQTSFPLFEKVEVNGDNTTPIYDFMKSEAPGILGSKGVKWNFTKFLINKKGEVVKRFAPKDKPSAISQHIESLL